jgi:hypothetical protein
MKAPTAYVMIVVAILTTLIALPLAGAGTITEKGRDVFHYVKVEVTKVGDVDGHVIGIAEGKGLEFVEGSGDVGNYSMKVMFDYRNGAGLFQGYSMITFGDGSTLTTQYEGTTTPHPSGVSTWGGTVSLVRGTGRFEGIQGTASFTGKRVAPLTPGGSADCYTDFVRTYTLPSK